VSKHARSHPPTLLTLARRTLEGECGLGARVVDPPRVIVAAVSGGRDSMALLHVLARLREPLAFTLLAHGVDHGLRDDAARELDLARALADSLSVPWKTTRVAVARGGNLQERARRARYEVLDDVARRAGGLLATAHHADDRAETVLLRILRGASVAGLAVLPARAGQRIRPFVRARREAIEAHVKRHAIAFADDPSNEDPRFMRTRVRRDVLPLLASLDAGIVEHLAGIADDAAAQAAPWGALPRATRDALEKLASTESTRARVILPGGRVARFDGDTAAIVVEAADEPSRPILGRRRAKTV